MKPERLGRLGLRWGMASGAIGGTVGGFLAMSFWGLTTVIGWIGDRMFVRLYHRHQLH